MKYIIIIAAVIAYFTFYSQAAPGGAPTLACETLFPLHNGTAAQNGTAPYSVSYVSVGNGTWNVTVRGLTPSNDLKGFILQARPSNNTQLYQTVGSFTPLNNSTKTISCLSSNDTATHTSKDVKTSVETQWRAPAGNGSVTFRATVAVQFDILYANITSAPLNY